MTQLDVKKIRSVAKGDPNAKVLVTKRFLRAVAEALDAPAVLDVPPDPFAIDIADQHPREATRA